MTTWTNKNAAFNGRMDPVPGAIPGAIDTDGQSQCVAMIEPRELQGMMHAEVAHADAAQTRPAALLRLLRKEVGEEAFQVWTLGVLAAFWPSEVLRHEVHGSRLRPQAKPQRGLVNVALSRSQIGSAWSVRDLWEAGSDGHSPQGWRPSEQLAAQLGAYLSLLPYAPSPGARLLHDLWEAAEGAGVLREALSEIQDARRSTSLQAQPAHAASVRRLVPEEAEALQGFPRGYTLVTYRGQPARDGPRYRALGNSMAVPVVRWIGRRIANALTPAARCRAG